MVIRDWLIIALLLLTARQGWAADAFIQLELDTETTYLNGSVILNVSATGLQDDLSMAALDNLPMNRRYTAGNHLRVHDGKLVQFASWRIELMPQETGRFVIGPLTAGEVVSNTLTLDVLEGEPTVWAMPEETVQLETKISSSSVYSQEMLVYEAVLKHRYPLLTYHFELPDFHGFRVYPDIVEKRTWESGGEGWRRIHWRYLLFPDQSGEITIGTMHASGQVIKSRWERADFERESRTHELTILAPPDSQHWWLPAASLELKESWDENPPQLMLGHTSKRILEIYATGVSASQLPEIDVPETRGLEIQLLSQNREEALIDGQLRASARFEYEVRPVSATPVFMDTLRLRWWSTTERSHQTAIIPARRLDVAMPDRQSLIDAYRAGLSWRQRLESSMGFNLPPGYMLVGGALGLLSLLYLASQLLPAVMHRKRENTHRRKATAPLLRALKQHDLETSVRWLNEKALGHQLNDSGQHLQITLNQALLQTAAPSAEEWRHWLNTARTSHLFIDSTAVRDDKLPTL